MTAKAGKRPDGLTIAFHQVAASEHLIATLDDRPRGDGSVSSDRRMLLDLAFAASDEEIVALAYAASDDAIMALALALAARSKA